MQSASYEATLFDQRLDAFRTGLRQDLEILELRLTLHLGVLLAGGIGVTLLVMLMLACCLQTAR